MKEVLPGFDNHHLVSFLYDRQDNFRALLAVHRKNRKVPSFGATRIWSYSSSTEALQDALRLSKLMSYKAALAGLPCGGAKVVIMDSGKLVGQNKNQILKTYAKRLGEFKDLIVTGADVGLDKNDLVLISGIAPNVVGKNDNAVEFTVLGLVYSIKYCFNVTFGSSNLSGRSFAIQGLGKIGSGLLEKIYPDAGCIYVCDTNKKVLTRVKKLYPKIIIVEPENIHRQIVDVFCPCALNHTLDAKTVSELKCQIVAGGANNQLAEERVGQQLFERDIVYAPDYVINAGGLIAVYDEYVNKKYEHKDVINQVMEIPKTLGKILVRSKKSGLATNLVANKMAEKIFNKYD